MSTKIDRLSELAKEDPKRRFFSIAHLITPEALYAAFRSLRRDASAGVDGVSYEQYEKTPREISAAARTAQSGTYQAQPLRRVYIPKENGKQRPISIPALEDKIVQKAMVEVLNAIYEQDFSSALSRSNRSNVGDVAPDPSVSRCDYSDHLHPALACVPSGSNHRSTREILLVDGVQYLDHCLCTILSSRAGIEIGLCFPFSLGM